MRRNITSAKEHREAQCEAQMKFWDAVLHHVKTAQTSFIEPSGELTQAP